MTAASTFPIKATRAAKLNYDDDPVKARLHQKEHGY
jgi:hypothetical protein